jgi:hypothetical protein
MWRGLWRKFRQDDEAGDAAESGDSWVRPALRLAIIFALLFAGVFFAFWWAGSAVRFSAARAADRTVPTWRISGMVRDAMTHQPIPWALVEDDPSGTPPFFRADADYGGAFELVTLAEPHRIRVSAPGYHPESVKIGRAWFEWMPRGNEKKNIDLQPFHCQLSPQTWGVLLWPVYISEVCRRKFHLKMCCMQHLRVLDSSWLA